MYSQLDCAGLRQLIESEGVAVAGPKILEVIEQDKMTLADVSLRDLFETTVGPVNTHLAFARRQPGFVMTEGLKDLKEAGVFSIGSSLFPTITGTLINATIVRAYDDYPHIWDLLTESVPSNLKDETFVGFSETDEPEQVEEGMPYTETGLGEKKWTATVAKYGRIISITEEAIYYDRTGQIVMRAQSIGEKAQRFRDRLVLNTIQDVTNYKKFNPEGTQETLYRTSGGTNSTTVNKIASNALVDHTDLQNVFQIFADMTDGKGKRIGIPGRLQMLVPFALESTMEKILTSTEHRDSGATTSVHTVSIAPPPRRVKAVTGLSSVVLDDQSPTTWYCGDFKKQFKYLNAWPLQVQRQAPGSEREWRNDIPVAFKVRALFGVAVLDDKAVVQSTA